MKFYIVDERGKRYASIEECPDDSGSWNLCHPDGEIAYCHMEACDQSDQTVANFFSNFLAPILGIGDKSSPAHTAFDGMDHR